MRWSLRHSPSPAPREDYPFLPQLSNPVPSCPPQAVCCTGAPGRGSSRAELLTHLRKRSHSSPFTLQSTEVPLLTKAAKCEGRGQGVLRHLCHLPPLAFPPRDRQLLRVLSTGLSFPSLLWAFSCTAAVPGTISPLPCCLFISPVPSIFI